MHGVIEPSSAHSVVTVTTPLSVCRTGQPLMTHGAVFGRPAVPTVIDHQTRRRRAVAGPPAALHGGVDCSDPTGIRRGRTAAAAPTDGPPGDRLRSGQRRQRLVPVPRASSPARYSRNPRRCASEPNKSSNRAAYPSSGPGATGHGRRWSSQAPREQRTTIPGIPPIRNQQTTASMPRQKFIEFFLLGSGYARSCCCANRAFW